MFVGEQATGVISTPTPFIAGKYIDEHANLSKQASLIMRMLAKCERWGFIKSDHCRKLHYIVDWLIAYRAISPNVMGFELGTWSIFFHAAKGHVGFWDVKSVSKQAAYYVEWRGPREREWGESVWQPPWIMYTTAITNLYHPISCHCHLYVIRFLSFVSEMLCFAEPCTIQNKQRLPDPVIFHGNAAPGL